jgi:hypothetical protein
MLVLGGFLLVAMGTYFIFVRPPLLPEDLRYMQTTLPVMHNSAPGLSTWLQKVFWVMGGYIFTTGLLIVFISFTSFRHRSPGVFSLVSLAGISSIGSMTVVNFMIGSDFKWLLLIFALPWAFSLILYRLHK